MKAKNGGKVPKDYVGAWEKSIKNRQGPAKKITAAIGIDVPDEHEETLPVWPVLPMPAPIPISNGFGSLTDWDDYDDDESEVVKALAAITPNISHSRDRVSQKTRRAQPRPMNVAHLNAVARDVKNGKISLPNVDLSTNSEFEYVWALVDSGAGAHVAKTSVFNEVSPVSAPSISLSTANGDALPHKGAHRVTSYNQDGSPVHRVFWNADVEMPILAVSELSKEGPSGSEVRLRQRDGFIRDLSTGNRQHVVKRRGVYFTKLYVRKSNATEPDLGFARPGRP